MKPSTVCDACGGRVTAAIGHDLAAALDVHIASCPAAVRRINAAAPRGR